VVEEDLSSGAPNYYTFEDSALKGKDYKWSLLKWEEGKWTNVGINEGQSLEPRLTGISD
jgi:hypothetical protein